jgi:hypothetical protein
VGRWGGGGEETVGAPRFLSMRSLELEPTPSSPLLLPPSSQRTYSLSFIPSDLLAPPPLPPRTCRSAARCTFAPARPGRIADFLRILHFLFFAPTQRLERPHPRKSSEVIIWTNDRLIEGECGSMFTYVETCPGGKKYGTVAQTKISDERGSRWFCRLLCYKNNYKISSNVLLLE